MTAGSDIQQAAQLAKRSRGAMVILLLVAAVAFGVAKARAGGSLRLTPLVTPTHALAGTGGDGELLGKASAPVLVEEYGDFQCGPCATFQQDVGPTIQRLAAQGSIRFVFHPVAFSGTDAYHAAAAATCAGDEGRFWPFHDRLYRDATQGPAAGQAGLGGLSKADLITLGQQVGLTDQRFTTCVQHGTYEPWARKVTVDATRRGVTGAPAIFVNSQTSAAYLTRDSLLAAIRAAGGTG